MDQNEAASGRAPGFLTTVELAQRFPWFKADYWVRLRTRGGGPTFLRVGNRILYRERDVLAHLDTCAASSTAEAKRQRRAA